MCPGQFDLSQMQEVMPSFLFPLAALFGDSGALEGHVNEGVSCLRSCVSLAFLFFACQEKYYSHMDVSGATCLLHLTLTPHIICEQFE